MVFVVFALRGLRGSEDTMAFIPWRSPLLPFMLFVALVTVTLAAQQRGGAPPAPAPNAAAPNPNATGVVNFEPTDGLLTRRLRFEAGARTNWHTHTHRQMLWAEEGRGLYQELGEPVKELVKDVPILTKANVPHWHGAAQDSHVVQLTIYGGDIKWGAPVTDAEYLGKKK
jgi:quercetin dioxygenase-like cupin family protein